MSHTLKDEDPDAEPPRPPPPVAVPGAVQAGSREQFTAEESVPDDDYFGFPADTLGDWVPSATHENVEGNQPEDDAPPAKPPYGAWNLGKILRSRTCWIPHQFT